MPFSGSGTLIAGVATYATSYPGVDPFGVMDSSVGLQAAIDATPSGGTLFIPNGTYKISGAGSQILNRVTPIRIIGIGAPILSVTSAANTCDIIRLAPSSNDSIGWQIGREGGGSLTFPRSDLRTK